MKIPRQTLIFSIFVCCLEAKTKQNKMRIFLVALHVAVGVPRAQLRAYLLPGKFGAAKKQKTATNTTPVIPWLVLFPFLMID